MAIERLPLIGLFRCHAVIPFDSEQVYPMTNH